MFPVPSLDTTSVHYSKFEIPLPPPCRVGCAHGVARFQNASLALLLSIFAVSTPGTLVKSVQALKVPFCSR